MFLATDPVQARTRKIRGFLQSEPSIALVLAAINFEWTVCRAVMFFSKTKNTVLRQKLRNCYSLEKYKELWKEEVETYGYEPLAKLVRNWSEIQKGFKARNVLVHGKDRYTRNMATPHVNALIKGVEFVDQYCVAQGNPLDQRMPVRNK